MQVNSPSQPQSAQQAPSLVDGVFNTSPQHAERKALEKSQRDEDLAVNIMKLAVEFHRGQSDDKQLVNTCERLWRWATSDTHALPEDVPNG